MNTCVCAAQLRRSLSGGFASFISETRVRGRIGFLLKQSFAAGEQGLTRTLISEAKGLTLFLKPISLTSSLLQGFSSGNTE